MKVEVENSSHNVGKFFSSLEVSKVEAEAVFRVILEQTVSPCGTFAFRVLGVRTRRGRTAVNGRTTRSVGDDHTIAEHLSDDFDIRSFAAACARAGELEERFGELRSLNGILLEYGGIRFGKFLAEFVVDGFVRNDFFKRNHSKSLLVRFSGADVGANSAAHTIERADLHSVRISFQADSRFGCERCGNGFAVLNENGADTSVRTYERALVTLNTVFCVPFGNLNRNASLFELRRSGGNASVCIECGGRKFVAFESDDRVNNLLEIFIVCEFRGSSAGSSVGPFCGNRDFFKFGSGFVDSGVVHLNDRVALLAVGLLNVLLHPVFRFGVRHDFGVDFEESRLHDSVGSSAEADGRGDLDCVDNVKFSVLFGKQTFHRSGEISAEVGNVVPFAVKKEFAAFFEVGDHIVSRNVRGLRASDEVRRVDKVRRLNGGFAETKVRNGDTARLFGVVEEITLSVHIGVIADNFDRVLVRADRTVGAETVELTTDRAFGSGVILLGEVKRSVSNVVVNTDGEVVLGFCGFEVLINGVNHRGVEFLRAETVSSAVNLNFLLAEFGKSGNDVEIKGFAERTGFFRSVENGDVLNGFGKSLNERFCGERSVKSDFENAYLVTFFVHFRYGFFDRFRAAAHDHDNVFRVGRAHVIEKMITSARKSGNFIHHLLNDCRNFVVIFVRGFSVLEVSIAVLSRTFLNRVIGVQRSLSEILDIFHIDEFLHILIVDSLDLGYFVARSETVEEVKERNFGFKRGKMRNQSKVHNFLNGVGSKHRESRLAASHNVGMVAENVKRMSGKGSRADVENAGEKFARDLIHVRDHKKKTLRCGVSNSQRACGKRTVNRACRAALGFHLGKAQRLTEHVQSALSRPFVSHFRHRRRRRDGVNRGDFAERVGDVRSGGITVDSHFLHCCPPIKNYLFVSFRES